MTKGTYGLEVNGSVEAMTKHSAPFSLPADRETELVKAGVAAYVKEPTEEKAYSGMKMAELRKIATAYGVDASKCRSKNEAIKLIDAAKIKAKSGISEDMED
jgi:hypothetical protein